MKNRKVIIIVLHILFWAINLTRNLISYDWLTIPFIILDQLIIASISYINYFILIPFLLQKNKMVYYIIWTLSFFTLFTIIYTACWYTTFLLTNESGTFPIANALTTSFLIGFYYGGASTFARLAVDWEININKTRDLLLQKTNAQIQLMKSNINLPFMLQSLTYAENQATLRPKNAIQPILQLSNILRYGLYESQSEIIELKREIEALNEYILLHNQMDTTNYLELELENYNENKFIIPNLLIKSTVIWRSHIRDKLKGVQTIKVISKDNAIEIKFPINDQSDHSALKVIFPEIDNQNFLIKKESTSQSISLIFSIL